MLPEINNDIYIISDTGTIRHCIGCFGYWIKTLGKCVLKDGYNSIGTILSMAGKVTIISRCFYGCYSPFVKNILDWSIRWMLLFFKDIPLGHGPNKNIGIALQKRSQNILSFNQEEDRFITPNWPRFLWKIQASLCFWYPCAKKNGLKREELKKKAD